MQPNGSEFLPSELLEQLWNASRPPPGNGTDVVTRQLLLDLVDQLNHTPFPTRNVVSVPAERQFVLPCWIQLIYAFLFGGMVLVAAVGNATVLARFLFGCLAEKTTEERCVKLKKKSVRES